MRAGNPGIEWKKSRLRPKGAAFSEAVTGGSDRGEWKGAAVAEVWRNHDVHHEILESAGMIDCLAAGLVHRRATRKKPARAHFDQDFPAERIVGAFNNIPPPRIRGSARDRKKPWFLSTKAGWKRRKQISEVGRAWSQLEQTKPDMQLSQAAGVG